MSLHIWSDTTSHHRFSQQRWWQSFYIIFLRIEENNFILDVFLWKVDFISWSSPFYLECSFHKSLIFRFQFQLIPPNHSDSKPNLSSFDVVVNIWHLPGTSICCQWWSQILLTHLFPTLIFIVFIISLGIPVVFCELAKLLKTKVMILFII